MDSPIDVFGGLFGTSKTCQLLGSFKETLTEKGFAFKVTPKISHFLFKGLYAKDVPKRI